MESYQYVLVLCLFLNQLVIAQNTWISATDENINYMGRVDFSDEKYPSYSYVGVTISTKFKGTTIKAIIKDYGTDTQKTTNYYNVVIDGKLLHKIQVNSTDTLYTLVKELENREHTLALIKRTESVVGKSSFGGFLIEGNELLPNQLPNLKMEFIGDSWTAGYGNEVTTTSPNTGFHSENQDGFKAWGYTLAKRFNAQYYGIAISGRGLYRNNTGVEKGIMPDEYQYIHEGNTKWDFKNYTPDLVFIYLGTNDFYPEIKVNPIALDSIRFINKYIELLKEVRENYGNKTKIICVMGNSKTDYWPKQKKHLTRWRNYVTSVVNYFRIEGDQEIYQFEMKPQQAPYGENWHPTIAEHNRIASQISPFVASLLNLSYSNYLPQTTPVKLYFINQN